MGEAARDLRQPEDESFPEHEIETPIEEEKTQKDSAKSALKSLRKAVKKGTEVEIAGKIFQDPEKIYENLSGALEILRNKGFKISKNDLYFRQFPGEIVGEAIGKEVDVDPTLLMHPIMRIVHVIAHELGHYQNKVNNDGLVEAYIRTVKDLGLAEGEGEGMQLTEKYNEALQYFYEFVDRVSKDGEDPKKVINRIYKYYYKGKYAKIYSLYKKRYIRGLKEESEKDEAGVFFQKVFPEFEVQDDKWYMSPKVTQRDISNVGTSEPKESSDQEADVVDLDEYRREIRERADKEIS